jgi:heat shock protein HslJ
MKSLTLFAATAAALVLPACTTLPDTHPLTGTQWQLVAIDTSGSTTTLTPALQRRHTASFLDGGELQLQLDCNRGRSSWTAGQPGNGAGSISIGPVVSTKMGCPQPSFGDPLAAGLGEAQRFMLTIDGRQLVLETPDLRLTFAAIE